MFRDYVASLPNVTDDQLLAAEHIDILTFNQIDSFQNLTTFQQNTLLRVVERLADFESSNEDMINSYLKSYSINGVSMQFGNTWNLKVINGVAVPSGIYELLVTTGLCYPAI